MKLHYPETEEVLQQCRMCYKVFGSVHHLQRHQCDKVVPLKSKIRPGRPKHNRVPDDEVDVPGVTKK